MSKTITTTYAIQTESLSTARYESQAAAAEALRAELGWDSIVISPSYSVGHDYGDVESYAVSAYETQEECDADQDGAQAPRIIAISRGQ